MNTPHTTSSHSNTETTMIRERETTIIERRINEILTTEPQTLIASLHQQIKIEHETLLRSITEERERFFQ